MSSNKINEMPTNKDKRPLLSLDSINNNMEVKVAHGDINISVNNYNHVELLTALLEGDNMWDSYFTCKDLVGKGATYNDLTNKVVASHDLSYKLLAEEKNIFIEKELALKFLNLFIRFCIMRGDCKMYDLCLMPSQSPEDVRLIKNKIYLQKKNDKQLEYVLINSNNEKVNGILDINVEGNLTEIFLQDNRSNILRLLLEKGHINSQNFRIFQANDIEEKTAEYFNIVDIREIILGIVKSSVDYEDKHIISKGKLVPNNTEVAVLVSPIGIRFIFYRDLLRKYFTGPKLLTDMQLNLAIIFLDFLHTLIINSTIGVPLSVNFTGFKFLDLVDLLQSIKSSQFGRILIVRIPENYTDSLGVTASATEIAKLNNLIQIINVKIHTKSGVLSFSSEANSIKPAPIINAPFINIFTNVNRK